MPGTQKLTENELHIAVENLPDWRLAGGKLHREYRFSDFVHAFGFMAMAALEIEKLGHHPEWLNVYNKVVVDLTTHDCGGVSALDVRLANMLDSISQKIK
jgi:4a-hydroxytetrahydrobiopterin dehydratase